MAVAEITVSISVEELTERVIQGLARLSALHESTLQRRCTECGFAWPCDSRKLADDMMQAVTEGIQTQ
nr:MAG TPA: PhnA Zinc-Ribbon [Caudoviricetes sp.]